MNVHLKNTVALPYVRRAIVAGEVYVVKRTAIAVGYAYWVKTEAIETTHLNGERFPKYAKNG